MGLSNFAVVQKEYQQTLAATALEYFAIASRACLRQDSKLLRKTADFLLSSNVCKKFLLISCCYFSGKMRLLARFEKFGIMNESAWPEARSI